MTALGFSLLNHPLLSLLMFEGVLRLAFDSHCCPASLPLRLCFFSCKVPGTTAVHQLMSLPPYFYDFVYNVLSRKGHARNGFTPRSTQGLATFPCYPFSFFPSPSVPDDGCFQICVLFFRIHRFHAAERFFPQFFPQAPKFWSKILLLPKPYPSLFCQRKSPYPSPPIHPKTGCSFSPVIF